MPDLFRGEPVPADALSNPALNYSLPEWQQRHPLADIESVIDTTLNSLRTTYNASKIGSVGYCFGGKYVARYLAEGKGIDAGFTAHPSNTQPEEWDAVASPISIAFGDLDQSNTRDNRTNIEDIFFEGNKTYQTSLYSNAEHGFAVRTNLSVPQKAFAQEGAYFQAVRSQVRSEVKFRSVEMKLRILSTCCTLSSMSAAVFPDIRALSSVAIYMEQDLTSSTCALYA
jgi:dienelactone hydrolase